MIAFVAAGEPRSRLDAAMAARGEPRVCVLQNALAPTVTPPDVTMSCSTLTALARFRRQFPRRDDAPSGRTSGVA
jgi:hypothetical protein